MGDIILLRKNEICPADVLLIDSQTNKFSADKKYILGN